MTVYDNMAFGLSARKVAKTEIDRRVREAAKTSASTSSSSASRRRCRAASAACRDGPRIVREPKAFLMDEPLSNLDAKSASRCDRRSATSSTS